jgi:predicted adenylyl cyclase CyaB
VLEVELKAWADLETARARLEALGKKPAKESVKEDVYFCAASADARAVDPLSDRVVRLRIDGDKAFVTAKKKEIQHGVEASEEIEFGADSPDAVKALLAYLGYRPFIRKRKESRVYKWRDGLMVELNRIVGLGEFVEVETLIPSDAGDAALAAARAEVREVLRALGVADDRIEARPYMSLLRDRGIGTERDEK